MNKVTFSIEFSIPASELKEGDSEKIETILYKVKARLEGDPQAELNSQWEDSWVNLLLNDEEE